MDDNKLQALKIIDVAKTLIADKDYVGARSKLLEVQCQFPSLCYVPQMIIACHILCAAEMTSPNGEIDWYWVLQLGPTATFAQISSQHKKLTALLEGIKGDFPGAVTALELVHNAYLVLSNMPKRLVFDSKRLTSQSDPVDPMSSFDNMEYHSDKGLIQEQDSYPFCGSSVSKNTGLSSAVIEIDVSDNILQEDEVQDSDKVSDEAYNVDLQDEGVNSSDSKPIPPWKSIHNEEASSSDNHVTSPMDNDASIEKSLPIFNVMPNQSSNMGFYNFDDIRKAETFAVGQIWAAYDNENLPRRYARINGVLKQPFRLHITWLQPVPRSPHEGKWCEVGLPVVCGIFNLHEKEDSLVEHIIFSHMVSYTASPANNKFEICPREHEVWAIYKDWNPFAWCADPDSRKGCTLQLVQITEGYPKREGFIVASLVKVDGFLNIYKRENEEAGESCFEIPLRCIYRFSHRLPAYRCKDEELSGVDCQMLELDPLAINTLGFNVSAYPTCQSPLPSTDLKGHSIKMEWSAEDFASGQVWAIYKDSDSMPRQYVVVNNVISSGEVSVTFLEPHPIYGEEISWVEEKLPPGCGTFRKGATTATLQMGKFSHLVACDQSTKKIFYKIYPKKGEVWAMYRNWNSKWKQQDFNCYHCRIVEILSDFCEDSGVSTAALEEVPGYKTFFQRRVCNDGFSLSRAVSRSEMLSFSHRIEAYAVPGILARGIPECSWHLEPDALPPLLAN